MPRPRRSGTRSLLLQFCTNILCSRRRARRGKARRLLRFVPHATPDIAASSRTQFLQPGRSCPRNWNRTIRYRWRGAARLPVFAQVRSLYRLCVHRNIRPDRDAHPPDRGANRCTSVRVRDLVVALTGPGACSNIGFCLRGSLIVGKNEAANRK